MTNSVLKGACLARGLETQASDSTGFRTSLRQLISHLDESQQAYDKIAMSRKRLTTRSWWMIPVPNACL